MDLLSAVRKVVPACWRSANGHVTQRQTMSDAVTTWIDQFDSFKWLNLIAVGLMKRNEQTVEVGTGKDPMDDR
jgi:hypothetical protein